MQIVYTIILAIVQGLSEFLPISSSGHLMLLEQFGVGTPDIFFNVMLHVGTLFAVLVALRGEWLPLVKKPLQKKTGFILVACVPTALCAVLFKYAFPSLLGGRFLGFGFVLTATLLFVGENFQIAQNRVLSCKNTFLSGVMQGIAVLPGVSRSGATISSLTFLGVDKKTASNFSFLMSIPVILGSAVVETIDLAKSGFSLSMPGWCIVLGVAISFVSGLAAIKFFLRLVEKKSLRIFVVYTALLGLVVSLLPLFL